MKTIKLYLSLLLILCSLLLASCEKPLPDPERDEALVLTSLHDTIDCNPRMGDMAALQLTWTAGTNRGTGSAISYTIDMDMADHAFAGGVHFEIGRTMDRTFALSHLQLVDSVMLFFPSVKKNQYARFDLRVRAKVVATGEEQVSPVIPLTLICSDADTTKLYLVGDAVPNGWDKDRASEMMWDMSSQSGYTWTGRMCKGEFKILATKEDWLPCYVRDITDETKMVYRKEEADYSDEKWIVDKAGNYSMYVDTKALTIELTYLGGELYNHIYMIGDATPGGWSWDNITELMHPEADIFTYEGPLGTGAVKFPTEIKSDWTGEMLFAPEADCAAVENGTFIVNHGDPDYKWIIPAAGTWSITIDIKKTSISFKQL